MVLKTELVHHFQVYACNFSEDGMWYRCMIRNSLGTDRVSTLCSLIEVGI